MIRPSRHGPLYSFEFAHNAISVDRSKDAAGRKTFGTYFLALYLEIIMTYLANFEYYQ